MNVWHSCFKFWRAYLRKADFTWVAVTKTVPRDYIGCIWKKLAPVEPEFEKTVEPVFNEAAFFRLYAEKLKKLDRAETLAELLAFSKRGKDVVMLNWEDLSRRSERAICLRLAIPDDLR